MSPMRQPISKSPPFIAAILCILAAFLPSLSSAKVISIDTFWQGEISVTEDILVLPGVTLTIRPGTRITVALADGTKTDPEYLSPLLEINVRGQLKVEGSSRNPVIFSTEEKKPGGWAGIIVDGGSAVISGCQLMNAETGSYILDGTLDMDGCTLRDNHYAIVAQGPKAGVTIRNSRVSNNDYGLFSFNDAAVTKKATVIAGNRKKDELSGLEALLPLMPTGIEKEINAAARRYYDDVLIGDIIWEDRIVIDGLVRVPEGSRLIVLPGTMIEFKKKDSNGDGIGENGLLIQGLIIAKGTAERPIIFRSAEKSRRMGDWDSINIINSDGARNLLEYCRIEDAYRGLHFHFSNVGLHRSIITNCYRGVQFQESAVELNANVIQKNKSGMYARDSQVVFSGNLVRDNFQGVHFFRCDLAAQQNKFLANGLVGLRIREGSSSLEGNLIDGSRYGLMMSDTELVSMYKNCITNNGEAGITIKSADNSQIEGNLIGKNGMNGISLQDTRAVIRNNMISENGERGIGIISFDGIITRNNFSNNGLYAIGLDGEWDVNAPLNWWGTPDIERVVYDKHNNPLRGTIRYQAPSPTPLSFQMPVCGTLSIPR